MRKLMLLMGAVAALTAFAIPASASAALLTSPAGTVVPVGTIITGTSTNATTVTPAGTLECTKVTAKGKVTKNSGGEATANSGGVGTTEGCKVKGGGPVTIHDPTLLSLVLKTPATSTASLTFESTIAGATCHYLGTNVPVTFVTNTDVITFTNAPLVIKGPINPCGTPGPAKFSGSFTLTAGGVPVIID